MGSDDDIDLRVRRTLAFRAAALARPGAAAATPEGLVGELPVRRVCAFRTDDPPGFLPMNGFPGAVTVEEGAFRPRAWKGRRPSIYANHLRASGVRGTFVFNTCDSARWDYGAIPVLAGTSVFQFSRLPSQRDRVILVPLNDGFMAPGSPKVPRPGFDRIPFEDKQPGIVWRGRMSGTLQVSPATQDWMEGEAEGLFDGRHADLGRLRRFPRYRFLQATAHLPGTDLGFVVNRWRERRSGLPRAVAAEIGRLVRRRMPPRRQLRYRYLLALEGNDYATSLFWGLASNSVVMMPEPTWETILHEGLAPWRHYVPLAPDGSDLAERLAECEAHPERMRGIVAAAQAHMAGLCDRAFRDAADHAVFAAYLGLPVDGLPPPRSFYDVPAPPAPPRPPC